MKSPEAYHARHHIGEFESCWSCQKARAICKSKVRLWDLSEAIAFTDEYNDTYKYIDPMVFYFCRWCGYRHMCTAKTIAELRRAERNRRKWVIDKHRIGEKP